MSLSPLQQLRQQYQPTRPSVLAMPPEQIEVQFGDATEALADRVSLKERFPATYGKSVVTFVKGEAERKRRPLAVGVLFSGGQAPGGHNVIAGLFDGLQREHPRSTLWGFLGGPTGLLSDRAVEIAPKFIDEYRNTGGFDMIGSSRTKIESAQQMATALRVCRERALDALVIIGGDDSNTNAALLAEYFQTQEQNTTVIGVPKTIDGDLKNAYIETSFGFDTATKIYSELVGNICRDAASACKYWHFIKLMGRSASHIALECALQTQPNICLISEEVAANHTTLEAIVTNITEVVCARAANGEQFGIVLVPEGLIEFIPEVRVLLGELNNILATEASYFDTLHTYEAQNEFVNRELSRDSSYIFSSLPSHIQRQLLMGRDPHGNVQVSRIETEKLLIEMVGNQLNERRDKQQYDGSFSALHHFFGYEGRCAFPSNFDSDYCYSLGQAALLLAVHGLTGYLASVRNLAQSPERWSIGGVPLTMMMNMEQRRGTRKPVVRKALIDLQGAPFRRFSAGRDGWAIDTSYRYPGAIQYWGPDEICRDATITLQLESGNR